MAITAVSFLSNTTLRTLSSAQIKVQSESLSRVRVPFTYLSLLQKMQDFGKTVVGFELFDLVELLRWTSSSVLKRVALPKERKCEVCNSKYFVPIQKNLRNVNCYSCYEWSKTGTFYTFFSFLYDTSFMSRMIQARLCYAVEDIFEFYSSTRSKRGAA